MHRGIRLPHYLPLKSLSMRHKDTRIIDLTLHLETMSLIGLKCNILIGFVPYLLNRLLFTIFLPQEAPMCRVWHSMSTIQILATYSYDLWLWGRKFPRILRRNSSYTSTNDWFDRNPKGYTRRAVSNRKFNLMDWLRPLSENFNLSCFETAKCSCWFLAKVGSSGQWTFVSIENLQT